MSSVLGVEFREDVRDVALHACFADGQPIGNLLVGVTGGNESQHIDFTGGQVLPGSIDKFHGDLLGYPPLPGMDGSNRLEELPMHLSLQQVTARTGLDGSHHLSIATVRRENDDTGAWKLLPDLTDGLNTVQAWKLDVHQRHIRLVRPELCDGFLPTGGLGHQLHVIFSVDQSGDPFAKKRMVIHRKNSNQARVDAHDFQSYEAA